MDQIGKFALTHLGTCYRNSNLAPASAEEPQSAMMARELLVDGQGKYVGDDTAVFAKAKVVTSDNDTRAPYSFIRTQNEIIGTTADNVAEHLPDKGHVMKCQNNAMFKIRQEDKSYSGVHLLSNLSLSCIFAKLSKDHRMGKVEARKLH